MAKVFGKVPRGFTRFYVLHLLIEKPMTGKEIIEEAEKQSEGEWTPSPGLIYPLLGRLVRGGLIEEVKGGKFAITPKGETALEQFTAMQEHLEKQVRLVRRLGLSILTAGKYIAEDAMDRIIAVTSKAKEIVAGGSRELQNSFHTKYKYFLKSELERLDEKKHEQTQEAPLDRNDNNTNKA
jgi:DNA-binding PadR family transcriptional regulator